MIFTPYLLENFRVIFFMFSLFSGFQKDQSPAASLHLVVVSRQQLSPVNHFALRAEAHALGQLVGELGFHGSVALLQRAFQPVAP